MKKIAKRGLSLVLALVMCLSVLGGISLPEAEAASYTYNWGARGDVADEKDFTRSSAEEWYAAEGVTYEELAQLSGSSNNSSVPSSALYQRLRSLMRGAATNTTSYESIKTLCQYTDCQNGGGKISSFYSGTAIGPGWNSSEWNREHTWPNSKGDNNGSGENDIFMLRPTSIKENSSRGNDAYGESGSYYNPNSESGGKYDLRGDVVRIMLFVYVRWQNISSGGGVLFGSSGVLENKSVMLKWLEEDPVDTWELGRNDSCQSITGTRNVFVDYPELGFLLFGEDVPDGYTSPSGEGNAVSYKITATSNNTSYGTVSLSGKTITATPKTGYYVTGYTVTSGSATVTQSGNTFRVEAKSDCTVRINFAAKTAVTLTFMENGVTAKTVNAYGGDSVTLPANTKPVADGYSFLGWTDGIVNDTTTKPTVYNAGTSVAASNKTYYAVYTYSVGGTGVTEWSLKNISEIKSGDVFMITVAKNGKIYALPNTAASSAPAPVIVDVSVENQADKLLWNIGGSKDAWTFYPNGDTSRWLSGTADNAGVRVDTGTNKTFKINSNYLYNNGTSRYFGVYNEQDWRCYTSIHSNIANQTLGFYVRSESGVLYYTTSTVTCDHEDTSNTAAVPATCTATGYTAGVYCNDCEQYISGHQVVAALGHSWGSWVQTTAPTCTATGVETATCSRCSVTKTQTVAAKGHSYTSVVTPPTATAQGYTTYTCSVCGHNYVGNYTDALGQTFYVSFSVPKDVAKPNTMTCGKNGITLPTAAAPEGYKFEGWTTAVVEDTDTKPTVYTGTYNATSHITLYAVYSYVEGGTGTAEYILVTDASVLKAGVKLVLASKEKNVVATEISSQYMGQATATFSGDKSAITSLPSGAVVMTLGGSTGAWTFAKADGKLLGATTVKKLAWSSGTTTWSISVNSNGGATIQNGTSSYGAFRYNTSNPRFTTYTSAVSDSMLLPQLYMETAGGTTYYTTLTTLDPVAAVDGETYTSFEAAYVAATDGQTVKLLSNIGESEPISLNMTHDLYIDLDSWYFAADVTANGYTIYGKDSITDTFDSEDWSGMVVTGATVAAQDGYVAYNWGGDTWSFHRYELKLIAVSLKPGSDALGYKAQFFGDEVVCDMVTGFGFTMGIADGNTVTRVNEDALENGQIFTLRLQNIMAANGGETQIIASAFVNFGDETVTTGEHTTSMRETILEVNGLTGLSAQQKAAVYGLYETYSAVMDAWFEGKTNYIATWKA